MNRYLFSVLLILCTNGAFSQQLIALDVDELYSLDGRLKCVRRTTNDTLELKELRLDDPQNANRVIARREITIKGTVFKKDSMIAIKPYSDWSLFIKELRAISYRADVDHRGEKKADFFQMVSDQHIISTQAQFIWSNSTWKTLSQTIYLLVPIELNNRSRIAGLRNIKTNKLEHLLIPTDKGILLARYQKRLCKASDENIRVDQSYRRDLYKNYKVLDKDKNKILVNGMKHPLLPDEYNELIKAFPFIVTKRSGRYQIYDVHLEPLDIRDIKAIYYTQGRIQLIADNQAGWLDDDGVMTTKAPHTRRGFRCGNVASVAKSLFTINDTLMERLVYRDENIYTSLDTTLVFDHANRFKVAMFLDSTQERWFSSYDRNDYVKENIYFFERPNGEQGLLSRINVQKKKIEEIYKNKTLSYQEKINQIEVLERTQEILFENKVVLDGAIDKILLKGNNQPPRFVKNGLWGFYPIMTDGKYFSISSFKGHLAEVVFTDGNSGWVDREGREIKRE